MRIFQTWLFMLQPSFIFIQYFGCSPLISLSIVLKNEIFSDISGLPDFIFEQFFIIHISRYQSKDKKNTRNYWKNIWWTLN